MSRAGIELVALDIAGTTLQEHGAVYAALGDAVRDAGVAVAEADVQRWMGAAKTEAVRALMALGGAEPEAKQVQRAHDDFRRRLREAYTQRPPAPFPGVPEALVALRGAGIRVALTTGFERAITTPLLERVGWDGELLDAVVCADDVPQGRPAPYMIFRAMEATGVRDVSAVLVAGDTVLDLQAGVNAGVRAVVGVLTGAVGAETLGRTRHTHLLAGAAELPALVAAL